MTGYDRNIVQTWALKDKRIIVEEQADRKTVRFQVKDIAAATSGTQYLMLEELRSLAHALTLAADRLEAFGAMNTMEKIVP